MGGLRKILSVLGCVLLPVMALADDRLVRVYAPDQLVETGVLKFAFPRFSLKTQVRIELVDDPAMADLRLGPDGRALFSGLGETWHMEVAAGDHPGTKRLADWLTSDVGKRTILGFAPDGAALFTPPELVEPTTVVVEASGESQLGLDVSRRDCARCHRVDEDRMGGIGSTPSFAVLRSLPDWEERFAAFYALNPHPSFTIIEDVTPPFPADRPPPLVPIRLTLDEVEAVLAYVTAMDAAELGAPLVHQ